MVVHIDRFFVPLVMNTHAYSPKEEFAKEPPLLGKLSPEPKQMALIGYPWAIGDTGSAIAVNPHCWA